MGFLVEQIPLEKRKQFEDKAIWYKRGRRWPLESSKLTTWAIDYDRHVFMRGVGGSSRPGDSLVWVLCVKHDQVQFRVSETISNIDMKCESSGHLVEYYIYELDVPAGLENENEEVKRLITEACHAYFVYYLNKTGKNTVKVHFSEPPYEVVLGL